MKALRVVAVVRGVDMRPKHALRTHWMKRVQPGGVAVLVNGDAKMARLVDREGGVHDYYAPKGVKFDEGALYNMVERGVHIQLNPGQNTVYRGKLRIA